jgi:hypothetical protein
MTASRLPDWQGTAALNREAAAKASLRRIESRMAARRASPRNAQTTARPPPSPQPPPGTSPRLGQQYVDWHGHALTWVGGWWTVTTPHWLADLLDQVHTDRSLSGRGGRFSPLAVALVDGLQY